MLVPLLTAGAFFLLGVLHVFWALGGEWGKAVTIPQREGKPLFRPGPGSTLLVALLLMMAGTVVIGRVYETEAWLARWGCWTLAVVFALRAIGDFHRVGFFKKVRGPGFAHWDTWVYSPLCVLLAAGCIVAARLETAKGPTPGPRLGSPGQAFVGRNVSSEERQ